MLIANIFGLTANYFIIMPDFKAFRKRNNLTQEDAANYFGCTQGFISQIEKGVRPIPVDFISRAIGNNSWDASDLAGEGEMLKKPEPPTVAPAMSDTDFITMPRSVWKVIEDQAASLRTKDEQVGEVIAMLKEQIKKRDIADDSSHAAPRAAQG